MTAICLRYAIRQGLIDFPCMYLDIHLLPDVLRQGCCQKTLQKIMGHSNIGITMNLYVHITEDEKQKEIDMVADALNVV